MLLATGANVFVSDDAKGCAIDIGRPSSQPLSPWKGVQPKPPGWRPPTGRGASVVRGFNNSSYQAISGAKFGIAKAIPNSARGAT